MTPKAQTASHMKAASAAFRTLMVHVEADDRSAARMQTAVRLAQDLDATLFGVGAEMIDPRALADPYGVAVTMAADLEGLIRDGLKGAEASFNRAAAGLRTEWLAIEEQPVIALSAAARAADLIIANGYRQRSQTTFSACDAGELVLKSGRPVLVTPERASHLAGEAVVVAWKDTREARRALADSLPFLKDALDVLVLEVCKAEEAEVAEAQTASVVSGLRRHGIEARAKVKVAAPEAASEQLEAAADNLQADLIVAGGYGHSRLGEWVLGGVTRDLLHYSRRFLLMSH